MGFMGVVQPLDFGKRLRMLRERRYGSDKKKSRERLAHMTAKAGEPGVSSATIYSLEERTPKRPKDSSIRLLGGALNPTLEEFPWY